MTSFDDLYFMKVALLLARRGANWVSPNPMVGAVVVQKGQMVGRGYHRRYGGPHAEVFALEEAGKKANGATLYVTLEPCPHYGKTPPCVDQILQSGIRRVVIGAIDPNPAVCGRGIKRLREKGVEVVVGVLEKDIQKLNEKYFKFMQRGVPFVTLKVAQSLDGDIATASGQSHWITSLTARKKVHHLRSQHDAVLIGVNTVITDDPQLTVRHVQGHQPRRIILDGRLRIPLEARVLNDEFAEQTLVFTTTRAPREKITRIQEKGAQVFCVEAQDTGQISVEHLLRKLGELGISSVLVEGGQEVFTQFLRSKQVDKMVIFAAPILIGQGLKAFGDLGVSRVDEALHLRDVKVQRLGEDIWLEGYLNPSDRSPICSQGSSKKSA